MRHGAVMLAAAHAPHRASMACASEEGQMRGAYAHTIPDTGTRLEFSVYDTRGEMTCVRALSPPARLPRAWRGGAFIYLVQGSMPCVTQ